MSPGLTQSSSLRRSVWALFAILCIGMGTGCSSMRVHPRAIVAPDAVIVDDLSEPVEAAIQAHREGKRVLVVFDIDDTLLTMPQDLGSDAWFNWRAARSSDAEQGASFDDLIQQQRLLFEAGVMDRTQPDAAVLVAGLQQTGVDVFALSARGPELRGPTERALAVAGFDFGAAPECGLPLCRRRGRIHDADIRHALSILSIPVAKAAYRDITVSDGVMLVAGQDKGVFLSVLLSSLPGWRYDEVYFIDDSARNVEAVARQARTDRLPVETYHYERMAGRAKGMQDDPRRIAHAEADLGRILDAICAAIASPMCLNQAKGDQ